MRNVIMATADFAAIAAATPSARADMVGAAAGAGIGLVVAGPVGAVAGGVVGAVYGKPFWGPSSSRGQCWIDNSFHRHCNRQGRRGHGARAARDLLFLIPIRQRVAGRAVIFVRQEFAGHADRARGRPWDRLALMSMSKSIADMMPSPNSSSISAFSAGPLTMTSS